jgi:hypothetical protein
MTPPNLPVTALSRLLKTTTYDRRELGVVSEPKEAVSVLDLRKIVAETPDTPLGKRDRSLPLLGFAGAFRRSELIAIDVEDCAETHQGLTATLNEGRRIREGEGRLVGVPRGEGEATCPIGAWGNREPRRESTEGHCSWR